MIHEISVPLRPLMGGTVEQIVLYKAQKSSRGTPEILGLALDGVKHCIQSGPQDNQSNNSRFDTDGYASCKRQ